jgi:predicted flap endonuclease-1-like 5' DNA nuclease
MQIEELPGVEPRDALSLKEAGIRTCQQLAQVARYPGRLSSLAQALRLTMAALRDLVDRAELSRLQGVGPTSLTHLLAAGVLTLSALAAQEPEALRLRLSQVTARPPNLAVVEHWIAQARCRRARQPGQEESPAPGSHAD